LSVAVNWTAKIVVNTESDAAVVLGWANVGCDIEVIPSVKNGRE
jgi:hypothetical protein